MEKTEGIREMIESVVTKLKMTTENLSEQCRRFASICNELQIFTGV